MSRLMSLVTVFLLTFGSGLLDARGFVFAARAWPDGKLDSKLGAAALLCFVGGLSLYILAVRFMQKRHVVHRHSRRHRDHGQQHLAVVANAAVRGAGGCDRPGVVDRHDARSGLAPAGRKVVGRVGVEPTTY